MAQCDSPRALRRAWNQRLRSGSKSFGWCLEELHIDDHSRFVLVTTNYDLVGETTLARLGYRID